ncbi:MAG: lipid IV(A) 3-deoxy-D-manno-octulosonic acid transferase [Campylobacterales bacterium]|nr:lipid IV(A) 3-deoxy-D-manno-octulosonic acid transferase [Campylobacterales bacterium]
MFKFFYLLLLLLLYIPLIPILFLLSFKSKYRSSIKQRFFPFFNKPFEEKGIWFHVCSFGETKAIKPILDELKDEKINISNITQTGFNEANKYTKNVRFLPFEIFLPFWIRPQKALIVLEAELWYMVFLVAKMRNTPTVLLNGRISDRSYKSYKRFSFLYKKIFENVDYVFAQSETDKERLADLGAKNIEVLGNIKLFTSAKIENRYTKPDCFITTGASTHKNEEELILNSWNRKGKLIIVPRHPERFKEVRDLMEEFASKNSFSFSAFSEDKSMKTDLILVDLMGELNEIYGISDLVILGGAFEKGIGGHNAVEPATFGCKVISGEHFFNQKALFPFIENLVISSKEDLKENMNREDLKPTKILNKPDIKIIKDRILGIC